MGNTLQDLANVTFAIAEAQGDPVLHVLPHAIGGFGQELVSTRQLISLPVLPPPIRDRIQNIVNAAVNEAVPALKTIKEQLCSEGDCDYKQLMKASGSLFKQATTLGKQVRGFMPRGPRMQAPMASEE
jgi:hypothetical protein